MVSKQDASNRRFEMKDLEPEPESPFLNEAAYDLPIREEAWDFHEAKPEPQLETPFASVFASAEQESLRLQAEDVEGKIEPENRRAGEEGETPTEEQIEELDEDLRQDQQLEEEEEGEEPAETWPGGTEPEEPEAVGVDEEESTWSPEDSGEEEGKEEQEEELGAPAGLGEREAPRNSPPEIILVAGANYPKFEQAGSVWERKRRLSAGQWREFCLTVAVQRLLGNPKLKVTLFDFLLGTRENVTLDPKKKPITTVEQSLTAPIPDDYWNLVGLDWSQPTLAQFTSATLEPANKSSISKKPQVSYFDGANMLSKGKIIKLQDYLSAMSKVTSPVISITNVYAYIEGFAGSGKKGVLLELHFFGHAFNVSGNVRYSGGPILLNSLDDPSRSDRNPLDKDARAGKDFMKPTMDPAVFAKAFGTDARSFIWGCNFQRGFLRQFVNQIGKRRGSLTAGRPMEISHNSDWGPAGEFRTRLGLSGTAAIRNVSVDLAKVEQVLKDTNQDTYMQKLATASGHPVVGAPPGTYADYDGSSSPIKLLHIPMTNDPFRAGKDSFELALLFFRDHLNFSFDTSFGDHNGLGRGYMIYKP